MSASMGALPPYLVEVDGLVDTRATSLAAWLQRTMRISSNIFLGRYYTFIPSRVPFNMCIGKPVAVDPAAALAFEADPMAFEAEVRRVHAEYKQELRRLYEANKARFGYEERALVFACDEVKKSK